MYCTISTVMYLTIECIFCGEETDTPAGDVGGRARADRDGDDAAACRRRRVRGDHPLSRQQGDPSAAAAAAASDEPP